MGNTYKRGKFEQAADFLLLAAPVLKNDTSDNKHRMSDVNDEGSDENKQNSGHKRFKKVDKGLSGVELRYY